jgi:ribose transport system ATP-binding protein
MVTISKISLLDNLTLVIFDEPTAFFENEKIEELFQYIQELKAKGLTIIYISHRLEEIVRICDRVTVLKDGQYVATKDVAEIDNDILISMMVGRTIKDIYGIQHIKPGKEVMRVEGLSAKGKFKDISFSLSKGEILGFFGLTGSGRSDVMKAIYGAEKLDDGKIFVDDKQTKIKSPISAMRAGIGLVPEDRIKEGVAPGLSVKVNINLNSYDMITRFGFVNLRKETERAAHFIKAIRIQTPSQSQKVLNISGGNQQKIVISKLLCRNLTIYIFDEPTVGVDIGAKDEIYRLIGQLTADGKAVILVSSYLPEVMGLSDRLVIIADGEKVGEINRGDKARWNEEEILKIASRQRSKDI